MALLRAGRPPRGALPKTAPRAAHVRGRRSRAYPDAALAHRCVARQGHPLERSLTSRTHPIVCTAHTPWQHPHRPHMTSTTRIHAPAQKQHRLSLTPAAPGPKRSTTVRPCSLPLPCRRLVPQAGWGGRRARPPATVRRPTGLRDSDGAPGRGAPIELASMPSPAKHTHTVRLPHAPLPPPPPPSPAPPPLSLRRLQNAGGALGPHRRLRYGESMP